MIVRNNHLQLVSTSVLVTLGILLSILSLGTNLYLARSLPSASFPSWVAPAHVTSMAEISVQEDPNPDMLHLVTSRFMQLQSHLLSLGEARLRLFETFCLPSMLLQEAPNFIWFIMTDPDLEPTLLARMIELLSPYPNFFLVLRNDNLVTSTNLTEMVDDSVFATGDTNLLLLLMFDTKRPLLLETRLDADDALNARTLKRTQEIARDLPVDTRGWQVVCNSLHYEWRNEAITDGKATIQSAGQLRLVMESICITAGYTLVRHRQPGSIDFPDWPHIGHHLISREWPMCLGKQNATADCWMKLPKYPAALRSRTATSAGMSRVEATSNDSVYDNQTDLLWSYVERDFGILQEEAKTTSQFFKSNLKAIVEDNLSGQCTFGHSCKQSSKKKLADLLAKANLTNPNATSI